MQFQLTKEFLSDLREALQSRNESLILDSLAQLHPADIAEIIDEITIEEAITLYQFLDGEKASEVLVNLEEDVREKILESLSSQDIAEIFIDNMESDDAADIISELKEDKREEVISFLGDVDQASDIVDLLNYEEGTAGALMAKELIQVQEQWSVLTCVKEMRRQAEHVHQVYTVYVVDQDGKLLGRLSVKKLLLTPATTLIRDIYEPKIRSVNALEPEEDVAKIMEKYDLVVLPVVDELGRLIGRITIDDIVDVIKEEAEKDYQMASGISIDVEASDSVWMLTRARLPWLLIGLLGGILGAQVIEAYEGDLRLYPEMAYFIPLIAAMGGNVGVQASAIIVQGLANQSMGIDGIFKRLTKEFGVALLNGVICSIILFGYNLISNSPSNLSITVSVALLSVIIVAGLFGTFIPLALHRYKIDPALATGPFITTVNDILGLIIYFSIGHVMYIQDPETVAFLAPWVESFLG